MQATLSSLKERWVKNALFIYLLFINSNNSSNLLQSILSTHMGRMLKMFPCAKDVSMWGLCTEFVEGVRGSEMQVQTHMPLCILLGVLVRAHTVERLK